MKLSQDLTNRLSTLPGNRIGFEALLELLGIMAEGSLQERNDAAVNALFQPDTVAAAASLHGKHVALVDLKTIIESLRRK